MVGANYMGGKRNAAKARTKDTTGRAEKRFFSRQRLKLALGNNTAFKHKEPVNTNTKSSIDLAHARQSVEDIENHYEYVPEPIHVSPCTPTSKLRLSKLSSEGKSTDVHYQKRPSNVLRTLDTSEPISLRAAMNKLLSMKDLAGLSKRRDKKSLPSLKRPAPSSSPCPHLPSPKRKKFKSPHDSPRQARVLASTHHDRVRNRDGTPEEDSNYRFNTNADASDVSAYEMNSDSETELIADGLQSEVEADGDIQSALSPEWNIGSARRNVLLPIREEPHTPSSLSSTQHQLRYPTIDTTPALHPRIYPDPYSSSTSSPYPQPHSLQKRSSDASSFSGNIFNYEDPWKAVGVVLGIEKVSSQSPVRKRNFAKLLEEIPDDDGENEVVGRVWCDRDDDPELLQDPRELRAQRFEAPGQIVPTSSALNDSPVRTVVPSLSHLSHYRRRRLLRPLASTPRQDIAQQYQNPSPLVSYSASDSGSNWGSDAPYTPTRASGQASHRPCSYSSRQSLSSSYLEYGSIAKIVYEEDTGEANTDEETGDLEHDGALTGIRLVTRRQFQSPVIDFEHHTFSESPLPWP